MSPTRPNASGAAKDPSPTVMSMTTQLTSTLINSLECDGAAISIGGSTSIWHRVYATDVIAERLDELQILLGQGPSNEAMRTGLTAQIPDLEQHDSSGTRTEFLRAASTLNVGSMAVLPLLVDRIQFGVIQLHTMLRHTTPLHTTPLHTGHPPVSGHQLSIKQLSGVAPIITQLAAAVLHEATARHEHLGRPELADILFQAIGMVSAQLQISTKVALDYLRAASFAEDVPLASLAADIVNRRRQLSASLGHVKE